MSIAIGLWGYVDSVPAPVACALAIGVFSAIVFGVNQLRVARLPHLGFSGLRAANIAAQSTRSLASQSELSQPLIRDRLVLAYEIPRNGAVVANKTFESCDIAGPAVIMFGGRGGTIYDSSFETPPEDAAFWEIPDGRQHIVGVIAFEECTFRKCRFSGIGIAGGREFIETMKQQIRDGGPRR
ncbi:MAG TPA: hypothetical protein VHY91_13960 [Pirellulales bacterium]|nr:hypothetical protein [Pirellulales bacterium]